MKKLVCSSSTGEIYWATITASNTVKSKEIVTEEEFLNCMVGYLKIHGDQELRGEERTFKISLETIEHDEMEEK